MLTVPLFDLGRAELPEATRQPAAVTAMMPGTKVTEAYDAWWSFACERQAIYYRRLHGELAPWTDDSILARYRFTNAYRAADRVSQYLIREVIYNDEAPQEADEVVFRILLFKLFNRIDTWEALTSGMGTVTLAEKPYDRIDEILERELVAGRQIYSAAYIMPTSRAGGSQSGGRKHRAHLELLARMMAERLGDRLADMKSMTEAFDLLRSYPMIGDFLAYQFVTDINYSDIVDFEEDEFVAAGPGAKEGLRKCFADSGGRSDEELIRMMMDAQEMEFERLGLDFQDLFGRRLQLIDCQNLFCEVAKYARVRFPALTPEGDRTRIKQKYRPTANVVQAPFFPPKWGINGAVATMLPDMGQGLDLASYQRQASMTSWHGTVPGGDPITTPMFGLIGETGEVVSELKKHVREGKAYVGFRDRLQEELGDVLWYAADLGQRRGLPLTKARRERDIAARAGARCEEADGWIRTALSLTGQTGRIAKAYDEMRDSKRSASEFDQSLSEALAALVSDLDALAQAHGLALSDIASKNLAKIRRLSSPTAAKATSSRHGWSASEQLPARFSATMADHAGRVSVSFVLDDQTTPIARDTLTDNAYDPDGYRFHDVFHFAYAAVLGWSPVTRSLLSRKRKSNPRVDEVEDGGRAVAIEEGISAMVFAYAAQHAMLEGVDAVDDALLRTIRDMTRHLEVRSRTAADWQHAILQGFEAWRGVRAAGGGQVEADGRARTIRFAPNAEQERTSADLFELLDGQ